MNMQSVNLNLLMSTVVTLPEPPHENFDWIANTGENIIDNLGNTIIFNVLV